MRTIRRQTSKSALPKAKANEESAHPPPEPPARQPTTITASAHRSPPFSTHQYTTIRATMRTQPPEIPRQPAAQTQPPQDLQQFPNSSSNFPTPDHFNRHQVNSTTQPKPERPQLNPSRSSPHR